MRAINEAARKYLAQRIKQARKDCKLTQKQLSEASGLSQKSISDIENGHGNPTFDNLCDLLHALNLSFESLLPSVTSEDDSHFQRWINCYLSSTKANRRVLLSNSENLSRELKERTDK